MVEPTFSTTTSNERLTCQVCIYKNIPFLTLTNLSFSPSSFLLFLKDSDDGYTVALLRLRYDNDVRHSFLQNRRYVHPLSLSLSLPLLSSSLYFVSLSLSSSLFSFFNTFILGTQEDWQSIHDRVVAFGEYDIGVVDQTASVCSLSIHFSFSRILL